MPLQTEILREVWAADRSVPAGRVGSAGWVMGWTPPVDSLLLQRFFFPSCFQFKCSLVSGFITAGFSLRVGGMTYREERCLLEGEPQIKLRAVPLSQGRACPVLPVMSDKLNPVEPGEKCYWNQIKD